jgi:hypothetical protein
MLTGHPILGNAIDASNVLNLAIPVGRFSVAERHPKSELRIILVGAIAAAI